jgi:hypothetical protein
MKLKKGVKVTIGRRVFVDDIPDEIAKKYGITGSDEKPKKEHKK